ncbi:MAG: hypothetical protein ACRDTS_02625, partial [Mycobacterium sp.]
MPTIWTLFRATAVVAGSSAALVSGGLLGTAHADPAPPVPVPNMGQQLVNAAANAPQMLQSLATALGAKPPAPATPPPLAGVALQPPHLPPSAATPGAASPLPGPASLLPGANSLVPGANSLLPGATPAAPAGIPGLSPTATGPAQLVPSAQVDLPQLPFMPVPLPQQMSLPGDLASLTPGGVPHGIQPGPTAVSAPGVASAAPSNP